MPLARLGGYVLRTEAKWKGLATDRGVGVEDWHALRLARLLVVLAHRIEHKQRVVVLVVEHAARLFFAAVESLSYRGW